MREKPIKTRILEMGRRIAEIRAKKGMTQERLAEMMDRSLDFVQVAELKGQITLQSLFLFADALKVRVEEFYKSPQIGHPKRGRPPKK